MLIAPMDFLCQGILIGFELSGKIKVPVINRFSWNSWRIRDILLLTSNPAVSKTWQSICGTWQKIDQKAVRL